MISVVQITLPIIIIFVFASGVLWKEFVLGVPSLASGISIGSAVTVYDIDDIAPSRTSTRSCGSRGDLGSGLLRRVHNLLQPPAPLGKRGVKVNYFILLDSYLGSLPVASVSD